MFGLKDEILYEAWLEYREDLYSRIVSISICAGNGASDGEPIWELIMVGRPLVDPEITILLRNAVRYVEIMSVFTNLLSVHP